MGRNNSLVVLKLQTVLVVYIIQSRLFKMQIFLRIVVGAFLSFNAAINALDRFLATRLC